MIDRIFFFAQVRKLFGKLSQSQVDGLNFLIDCFEASKVLTRLSEFAYILATIFHETAYTMRPIEERGSYNYFKYLIGKLGIKTLAMANMFKGRGYVMITGWVNYFLFEGILNIPLTKKPELACVPATAWEIIETGMYEGKFTGVDLDDYINSKRIDFVNARRIVNGKDKAYQIAGYANIFYDCLEWQTEADNKAA